MDFLTKKQRSVRMAAIKDRGNRTTELRILELFRQEGIHGWRRHWNLEGKPDFVFPRERLAVFVDGCFWHGCPHHFKRPRSRRAFWNAKVARNKARDLQVNRRLREKGWTVIRIWEHSLTRKAQALALVRIRRVIGRLALSSEVLIAGTDAEARQRHLHRVRSFEEPDEHSLP